jgi:hypothetical protein
LNKIKSGWRLCAGIAWFLFEGRCDMSIFRSSAIVAAALFGAVPLASAAVFTFQDGVAGYDGTQDASLYPGGDADVNTGALTVTYANSGTFTIHKFDLTSLAGMTVTAPATLALTIADTSLDLPASVNFSVFQITDANAGWAQGNNGFATADPGEVTYNNLAHPSTPWAGSPGLSTAGVDYVNTDLGPYVYDQLPAAEGTTVVVTLPAALVQHWIDVANAGVVIRDVTGGGAVQFYDSENGTINYRPLLTVTAVPEPASMALLGMLGLGLFARRQRV